MCEHLMGFATAMFGGTADATSFAHSTISLLKDLESKGFRRGSNLRTFRCGITGRKIGRCEVGACLYNRLNKFSAEKARCRTWGVRDVETNQPISGKESGRKALRVGVMEFQSFREAGAAAVLDDASLTRSDLSTLLICECGNPHIRDINTPCTVCGSANQLHKVPCTTAFTRLWQICESMHVGLNFKLEKK